MQEMALATRLQADQDRFAMEIIDAHGENLPASIEDLIPVLAFSQAKMKAYNALSDAAKKVQDQEELNKAALESGQRWGIVHLYGQKRLGEITSEMPKDNGSIGRMSQLGVKTGNLNAGKLAVLASQGLAQKPVSDAERIAAHPEILERIIEEAKERGDIPTKSAVLREIKAEKAREQAEVYRAEVEEKKEVVRASPIEVQKYLSALRTVLYSLPDKVPSEGWNDASFSEASAMVAIIRERLEVWK